MRKEEGLEKKIENFKIGKAKKIVISLIVGAASLLGNADKADACGSWGGQRYYSSPSFRSYNYPRRYYWNFNARSFNNRNFRSSYRYYNNCW